MAKHGDVPGPQRHAEGAHGEKTHRRFIEQLQDRKVERKQAKGAGERILKDAEVPHESDSA